MKQIIILLVAALFSCSSPTEVKPQRAGGSAQSLECSPPVGNYVIKSDSSTGPLRDCVFGATAYIEGVIHIYSNGTVQFTHPTPPQGATTSTSIVLIGSCSQTNHYIADYFCGDDHYRDTIEITNKIFKSGSEMHFVISPQ